MTEHRLLLFESLRVLHAKPVQAVEQHFFIWRFQCRRSMDFDVIECLVRSRGAVRRKHWPGSAQSVGLIISRVPLALSQLQLASASIRSLRH